ncbi:hypothetical protein SAMN05421664_1013 [Chryseobacterium soldanellicola]|uniref:Uncharacterized protein n=1 Tax=Chryseobacterium soldanellicola TaxID=311333 RepID=A0A1H0ZPF2_9FLAO|nr:hypothetical protein SAMN05421664_1013 [Chryseobacterium soldanellicola]
MKSNKELNKLIKEYNAPLILQNINRLYIPEDDLSENTNRQVSGSSILQCSKKFKYSFFKNISKL